MRNSKWKKVLKIMRPMVEVALGLTCIMTFPEHLTLAVLGYLGMPRRYHPPELQRFHALFTFADFLWTTIILTVGILCLRDVFRQVRKLRTIEHDPDRADSPDMSS